MNKQYVSVFIWALLTVISHCGINAQNAPDTPDEPVLESVEVDPDDGIVTIKWSQPSPAVSSMSIDGYIIFWLNSNTSSNYAIDTVWNAGARQYMFDPDAVSTIPSMPDPRQTTVPFTIASVHRSPLTTSLRSDQDYNIQVVSKYDSCRAEIRLHWHPYRGWYQSRTPYKPLISYKVMRIPEGGGTAEEIKILSDQDTTCIISPIEENRQYAFYIEAERSDGVKVTSYKTEKYTKMPLPPAFIKTEGTQYNSQDIAEITVTLDPDSQTHSYEFLGSSKPDYSFVSLGTLDNVTGNSLVLTDDQTRGKTYYYKLAAWHVCKNRHTLESNTATALWLYLKQDDQVNTLQWDAYEDWGVPVKYDINRQIGSNAGEVIATLTDADGTTYKDNLENRQIDGDVCYWITATPVSPGSVDQHVVSNSICIQPESDIFVPQAFTPNGDGNNDEYKPFFSYGPQEYMFIAYDRNGAKVFETKNMNEGWYGRLANGKPASEGVYVYYIRFRTAKGRLVEKKGTFTLVMP